MALTSRLAGPHPEAVDVVDSAPETFPASFVASLPASLRRIRSGDLRPAAGWLLLLTFALTPVQHFRIGPHITAADITLLGAGALTVLSAHRHRPIDGIITSRLAVGLALMAVGGAVGLLFAGAGATSPILNGGSDALSNFTRDNFSPTSASSIELLVRLAGVIVLCFVTVIGTDPSPRLLRRCLTVYVAMAAISAAVGTLAATTSLPLADFQSGVGRATGLAGNANVFGVVTAIGAVFAAALACVTQHRGRRRLLVVALAIQVVGLAYSGSRGAMVGVAVGLAIVAVRLARTGRRRPVIIGAGLIVVGLVVGVTGLARVPSIDRMLLRTDTRASSLSVESTDVRVELFSRALDDRGLGSLVVGSGLREQPATSVHNGHFEVWLGLGALGVVGWLLVCWVTCAPAFRACWQRDEMSDREQIRFAVSAAFVAFVVTALTVNNVWNRYLWLLVAVVAFLGRDRPPGSSFAPNAARRRQTVALLMLLSFALMPLVGVRLTKVVSGADIPLALAAGLALMWGPFGRSPRRLLPPLLKWGAALLVAGSVLGLFFAPTPLDSGILHGRLVMTMVMCWVAVAWWDPAWREVRHLLQAFIAGAAVSAALGAFSALTLFSFAGSWRDVANGTDRATGLTGNANHLGVFCALALVMACVLAAHERNWLPYGVAMVPLLAGMLWSGSRSGVVAIVVALMFLAVHVARMGKGRWVAAVGLTVFLVFVLGFFSLVRIPVIDRVLLRTDTEQSQFSQDSTNARVSLARERLDEAGSSSLVVGNGMVNRSTTGPHSGHLEIWIGLGLTGLVGWLLICLSTIRPVFALTWSRKRLEGRALILYATALTFVAHMVLACFLEHIWTRYIWLLVGLSAVLASPYDEQSDDGAGDGDRTRVIRLET